MDDSIYCIASYLFDGCRIEIFVEELESFGCVFDPLPYSLCVLDSSLFEIGYVEIFEWGIADIFDIVFVKLFQGIFLI